MAFSGLAALLSKESKGAGKDSSRGYGSDSDDSELLEESAGQELASGQSPGFQSSAADAMSALKSGDTDGFAEALAACIQMAGD